MAKTLTRTFKFGLPYNFSTSGRILKVRFHKSLYVSLNIGASGLECQNNLWYILSCETFIVLGLTLTPARVSDLLNDNA